MNCRRENDFLNGEVFIVYCRILVALRWENPRGVDMEENAMLMLPYE
jgi:hypothetical protein